MKTSIKTLMSIALFVVGLINCPEGITQEFAKTNNSRTSSAYVWHDGSKGGAFGIGEGWSFNIVQAKYETLTEVLVTGSQAGLKVLPAEYEWIKDETVGPQSEPQIEPQIVTIPPTYMTITETTVIEPEKIKYYVTAPIFNPDGSLMTPAQVLQRHIPARVEKKDRRVIKTPERKETRFMPAEYREGYRRVIRIPAKIIKDESESSMTPFTRHEKIKPAQFLIKNPNGEIAHRFESYEAFKTFTDSLL